MSEVNPYENIETLRSFFKLSILEFLDKKHTDPPKFPILFKDFPDFNKLNFGIKLGSIFAGILVDAKNNGCDDNMIHAALIEATTDLHDTLLLKYKKIG